MERTWRWFGKKDKITLAQLKQIGVEGIVTALHDVPLGEVWTREKIHDLKTYIESYGMRWSVVESLPVTETIKYGGADRDEQIEVYKESLRNLGKEGILETKDGYPVLGENGVIHLDEVLQGAKFSVDENGIVQINAKDMDDEDMVVDRMKIVRFENERYLKKTGNSMWMSTDVSGEAYIAEGDERPKTMQGYMETSNVNVVNEMVKMIEVNRAYEASQKTIQSEDTMMSTLWSKVALAR